MSNSTREILNRVKAEIGNKIFNENEVKGITFKTFRKYVQVKTVYNKREMSFDEVCEMLNNFYDDNWVSGDVPHYEHENNKVYEVKKIGYEVVKWHE